MMNPQATDTSLETPLALWRDWLQSRQSVDARDAARWVEAIRVEGARLVASGLAGDEAFLLALRRGVAPEPLCREFLVAHPAIAWRPSGDVVASEPADRRLLPRDGLVAVGLACAAAVGVKLLQLFGMHPDDDAGLHLRWGALVVLALLAGYFAWRRPVPGRSRIVLAVAFGLAALFALAWPFTLEGDTEALALLHLPVVLWLFVGLAHAGGEWNDPGRRMAFIRFSGAWFILYVLIALGGGVLTAFVLVVFDTIDVKAEAFAAYWMLPCGAAGAALIAAWLVDERQGLVAQVAPLLSRLFTPLFSVLLLAFLGTVVVTGRGLDAGRELLIAFDLVLVVVLGLMLFAVSARDPRRPPGAFDILLLVLLVSALLADALALWAIAARIGEFGFTPNRVAGLGLNLVLGINLAVSTVLYLRFQRGAGSFAAIERWQTAYLPVIAGWAGIVLVLFPPLFGFR